MFSDSFFQKELFDNRKSLLVHAKKLENIYKNKEQDLSDARENWRDLDEVEKYRVLDWTVALERPDLYFSAILCPYFLHVKDGHGYSYISSDISFQNILKYTTARASYLRYNAPERRELTINGDNISAHLIKDEVVHNDSWQRVIQVGVTKNYTNKREHRIISNISDTLLQEQDQSIRAPKDSNTLITGPAGSWKTNALLHRMDYLVSEEDLDIHDIALFCFNVWLKKYLEQSVSQILWSEWIVISFDKWQEDLMKSAFVGRVPSLDYNNKKKLGTDEEILKFVDRLSKDYSAKTLKNILLSSFRKERELIKNVDLEKFEERWDSISKEVSSVVCLFTCWIYLIDLIKDGQKNTSSFFDIFKRDNKRNIALAEKIFSEITEEYLGFDFIKKQFDMESILNLWKSRNKESSIDYNDASSPVIRSQLIYIIKDIAKCLPRKYFLDKEKSKIFQSFEHVLVDEFQDLWPHQLLLIKNFSNQWITIAGDITQSLYLEPRNGDIKFSFPIHNSFKLSVTHRSTLETIQFANEILHKSNSNYTKSQKFTQQGDRPLVCKLTSEERMSILIKNAMQKYPTSSFLVTSYQKNDCEYLKTIFHKSGLPEAYIAERDSWDFSKNLHIANYLQVKGLEFDFVVVTGLGDFLKKYYGPNKENILYTILTRAKKRVIIIHNWEKEVEDMLKWINQNLYEVQNY